MATTIDQTIIPPRGFWSAANTKTQSPEPVADAQLLQDKPSRISKILDPKKERRHDAIKSTIANR